MKYQSYESRLSSIVSRTASGSNGASRSSISHVTVKDTTGTGFFASIFNWGGSEKQISTEQHGDKATVTIKDTTNAGFWEVLTGNSPERRYNATQVGDKVIVQETANSGSSWWGILTGIPDNK